LAFAAGVRELSVGAEGGVGVESLACGVGNLA